MFGKCIVSFYGFVPTNSEHVFFGVHVNMNSKQYAIYGYKERVRRIEKEDSRTVKNKADITAYVEALRFLIKKKVKGKDIVFCNDNFYVVASISTIVPPKLESLRGVKKSELAFIKDNQDKILKIVGVLEKNNNTLRLRKLCIGDNYRACILSRFASYLLPEIKEIGKSYLNRGEYKAYKNTGITVTEKNKTYKTYLEQEPYFLYCECSAYTKSENLLFCEHTSAIYQFILKHKQRDNRVVFKMEKGSN